MKQTFQCSMCGVQNYVGQPVCWNCHSPFQWNCPNCKAPVQNTMANCPNCHVLLPWPSQQQNKQSYVQNQNDYEEKSKVGWNPLLVGVLSAFTFIIIVGGIVFAINNIPKANQSLSNQIASTQPTPNAKPVSPDTLTPDLDLTDILVKLDDLPVGWYQDTLEENKKPEKLAEASRIHSVFRNKEGAISLSNTVVLYKESYISEEFLGAKSKFSSQSGFQKVQIGDDGFFYRSVMLGPASTTQPGKIESVDCKLEFISGQYFVWLESYGQGLNDSTEEQNLEFLISLANKINGRIP